jgi:ankyrin repeat protein
MRAAYKGHAEIVAMILEHCKDDKLIKQTDGKTQATALHCAVANKNIRKEDTDQYVRIINNLIEHGAELEARDINGLTPLHYACRQTAKSKLIRALIDAGADTTIKWSGMTAYDFLKARLDSAEGYTPSEGQKETLKMLQAYNTVRPFSGCKLSAMSPKLHLMDEPSV